MSGSEGTQVITFNDLRLAAAASKRSGNHQVGPDLWSNTSFTNMSN
jgi:hypothetical protein